MSESDDRDFVGNVHRDWDKIKNSLKVEPISPFVPKHISEAMADALDRHVLVNKTEMTFEMNLPGDWSILDKHVSAEKPAPLTISQMRHALDRITYKRDWKFKIRHDFDGVIILLISVDNIRDSTIGADAPAETTLNGGSVIPRHVIEKGELRRFYDFVRAEIRSMEMHEMDEWFKVDGQMINDPHAIYRHPYYSEEMLTHKNNPARSTAYDGTQDALDGFFY